MFSTHVTKHLSAYCQGQLSDQEARRIAHHLKECESCAAQYEEIKRGVFLASHLGRISPPSSMSSELEAALVQPRMALPNSNRSKFLMRLRPVTVFIPASLILIASLSALIWYFIFLPQAEAHVSLDNFLGAIESHPRDTSTVLSDAPAGFEDTDERTALVAAGLERVSEEIPLPGYRLAFHRLKKVDGHNAVQLVYRKENRAFSVFVVPRPAEFSFGHRDIKDAGIDGIVCRQVDCPRTSTLLFGAGQFICVLVTKSKDTDEVAAIIHYFVSAHQNRSQK